MLMKVIIDDLPHPETRIALDPENPERPQVRFGGVTDYARRSIAELPKLLGEVLAPLPVESAGIHGKPNASESHLLGTVVMGTDPKTTVVDRHLRHHRVRNLAVLGGSAFPTGSPSNPTLTLSALSIWSARAIWGSP